MDNETTIKRIQELVPSLMALEFGCVVETNIFPSYPLHFRLCYKTWKSDILVCENNEGEQALLSMNDCTILGKPITLAVVLMAVNTKYTEWENPGTPVAINSKGEFQVWSENPVYKNVFWDLSKDNFNDQSEETKTFIGKLLVEKKL